MRQCGLLPNKRVKQVCDQRQCPYHSVRNDDGCWFGDEFTPVNYAFHKARRGTEVKEQLDGIYETALHYLLVLKYAEYCQDDEPTAKDVEIWERIRYYEPYCLKPFQFITLERFARMRRGGSFDGFRTTGVAIPDGMRLKEFLTKYAHPKGDVK